VVTNRDDVDAVVRKLRNHGSTVRSVHSMGYNSRLDDIHAAVLGVKLKHITKWTDRRRAIAARYTKGLQGTSLKLPYEPPGYRHAYHLYVVETPQRASLEKFLLERGVDVKLHYPIAIHQQEGYPWGQLADPRPDVPNCERNAAECVSLPMFPELTDAEVDYTIEQCLAWEKQADKRAS
jgi:dTDP-4-amino-4,6-dideoxygalactose transaminase